MDAQALCGVVLEQRYQLQTIWHQGIEITHYQAFDRERQAACWILCLPLTPAHETYMSAFQQRVERFQQLNHPQVPAYQTSFVTQHEQTPYFCQVIRHASGFALSTSLTTGQTITERQAIQWLLQACRVLDYLHHLEPPLLHLAIEPGCMLINDKQELCLTGFGLTRNSGGKQFPLSLQADYLSLELKRGEPVPASDLYSLGMSFIHLLTGKPAHLWPEHQWEQQLSPALASLLVHMTEKEAKHRITIAALRPALQQLLNPSTQPATSGRRFHIPVLAGLMLLAGWGVYQWWPSKQISPAEQIAASSSAPPAEGNSPVSPNTPAEIKSTNGYFMLLAPPKQGEQVVFRPAQMSHLSGAWATLVPSQAKENDWEEQYFIHPAHLTDAFSFRQPVRPGSYEIRLYSDWPKGGFSIQDRLKFDVGTANAENQVEALPLRVHQDFKRVDDDMPGGIATGQSSPDLSEKAPEIFGAEPPVKADAAKQYGCFYLGNSHDRCFAFIIQGSDLFVDLNNNEDLTDDGKPYGILRASIPFQVERIDANGKSFVEPYYLWFFYNPNTNRYGFYSRTYFEHELNVGGLLYKAVAFESSTHNGLYRDEGVYFDLNRNNQFDNNELVRHHQMIQLGSANYEVILDTP